MMDQSVEVRELHVSFNCFAFFLSRHQLSVVSFQVQESFFDDPFVQTGLQIFFGFHQPFIPKGFFLLVFASLPELSYTFQQVHHDLSRQQTLTLVVDILLHLHQSLHNQICLVVVEHLLEGKQRISRVEVVLIIISWKQIVRFLLCKLRHFIICWQLTLDRILPAHHTACFDLVLVELLLSQLELLAYLLYCVWSILVNLVFRRDVVVDGLVQLRQFSFFVDYSVKNRLEEILTSWVERVLHLQLLLTFYVHQLHLLNHLMNQVFLLISRVLQGCKRIFSDIFYCWQLHQV